MKREGCDLELGKRKSGEWEGVKERKNCSVLTWCERKEAALVIKPNWKKPFRLEQCQKYATQLHCTVPKLLKIAFALNLEVPF
jgi:hypothetical protein